MLDLSKIAGMDLEKLPGVEQSGERCIRNIQEWLLHEVSSDETAILPGDKLQRIMVGVCISFLPVYKLEFATYFCFIYHELEFSCSVGLQPTRDSHLRRRMGDSNEARCSSNP